LLLALDLTASLRTTSAQTRFGTAEKFSWQKNENRHMRHQDEGNDGTQTYLGDALAMGLVSGGSNGLTVGHDTKQDCGKK
jgi:hypothetical protein